MGLALKLKEVLGDYKNRRNSSSTAQASLYRGNDVPRTPTSFRTDVFPRPNNDSKASVNNKERWIGLPPPDEELSPTTSKFGAESRGSGHNISPRQQQHQYGQPGEEDEDAREEVWPRVTGLRKPNHAADPLYHQRHYRHYLHPKPPASQASSSSLKNTKKRNKLQKNGSSNSSTQSLHLHTKLLPPTPPEEAESREGTSFFRSSHSSKPSTSSASSSYRRHKPGSSTSSSVSFFPWRRPRRGTGATAATSTTASSSFSKPRGRCADDDDQPLYPSSLAPEPRQRALRETIPSSAVFGADIWGPATAAPIPAPVPRTPERGSIIVGIEQDLSASPPPPPQPSYYNIEYIPPPIPRSARRRGGGHLPKDSLGSISRRPGGPSSRVVGGAINEGSDSSSSSRVSTGAVGGMGPGTSRGASASMGFPHSPKTPAKVMHYISENMKNDKTTNLRGIKR
ncbi:hypothetical protein F4810DRAFT_718216 [Camillea tinctor]|nr:hypothetical protein F4810DRAFT_718216 [Camillea tinctor]